MAERSNRVLKLTRRVMLQLTQLQKENRPDWLRVSREVELLRVAIALPWPLDRAGFEPPVGPEYYERTVSKTTWAIRYMASDEFLVVRSIGRLGTPPVGGGTRSPATRAA